MTATPNTSPKKQIPSSMKNVFKYLFVTGSLLSMVTVAAEVKKPNVIVIFTDDHGYADLSCMGMEPDVKTPNLDRLAKEGVRFTNGYVTAPQCGPSRAGLLTGRYQSRFGYDTNGQGPCRSASQRSRIDWEKPGM